MQITARNRAQRLLAARLITPIGAADIRSRSLQKDRNEMPPFPFPPGSAKIPFFCPAADMRWGLFRIQGLALGEMSQ
jgi:hypothetical protein